MSFSITSHWHLITNTRKALLALSKLNPRLVRCSSYQYPLNQSWVNKIKVLTGNGFNVLPICGSDSFMKLSFQEWERYVKSFAVSINGCQYTQVLNEVNTKIFAGAPPNSALAFDYFYRAVKIIKDKNPNIKIVAPGLTCENKSDNKTKIAAPEFLSDWFKLGAEKIIDVFPMHFYDTDYKQRKTLATCIKLIKAKAPGKPIAITETGSGNPKNQIEWYKKIKGGIYGITGGYVFYYCLNGHKEPNKDFNILNDNCDPNPIFYEMIKR